DLVYLIRVVVGDALPYPKVTPEAATYTVDNGVISVDGPTMGAAYVVVRGEVEPRLLAENMDIKYGFDGTNTNILVYSFSTEGFTGDFLEVDGEVLNIELAAYDGAPINATNVPANYELFQNAPNPFNPTTTISFALPQAGDYTLTIYNITGQIVDEFSGTADAGTVEVEWDASKLASGVYFYRLTSGNFTATKKAVLLK
ncbi:MAG: T9SS C-terminal target domain-containing protein, partial [Candidatus Zixiibacteriota bacterium]